MGARANDTFNFSICNISPKYIKPIPLAKSKLEDLKILVRDLVPAYIHLKYWNSILGNTADSEDNNEDFHEEHDDNFVDLDPLIDNDPREDSMYIR